MRLRSPHLTRKPRRAEGCGDPERCRWKKTANSLRISGLSWCHQYCLHLYSCVFINYIHSLLRWIISFAPLISYGIMGILHKTFLTLIPLADSQSSLYIAKLAIIRYSCNALIVKASFIYLTKWNSGITQNPSNYLSSLRQCNYPQRLMLRFNTCFFHQFTIVQMMCVIEQWSQRSSWATLNSYQIK